MDCRRISGALGAEVSGVDLSKPLSKPDLAELRKLWLEHLVLFFRDQPLTPPQFMDFARQFGEPVEYPLVKGIEGFPKIIEVKKLEHERVRGTEQLLVKATFYGAWPLLHVPRRHVSAAFPCADGPSAVIPRSPRALRHAK